MALSKTTQDHDEIRQWAEARGGKPAEVASTEQSGQTGIIRLEFPGAVHANDSALKEISWDEFFEKFDASGLALVYQEQTADGDTSNFNKLIHPENASPSATKGASKKATAKKASAKAAKSAPGNAKKGASASAAKKSAPPAKKTVAPGKPAPAAKAVPAKKGASPAKKAAVPAKKSTTAAKKTAAPAKKAAAPAAKNAAAPVKKTPAKKLASGKGGKR